MLTFWHFNPFLIIFPETDIPLISSITPKLRGPPWPYMILWATGFGRDLQHHIIHKIDQLYKSIVPWNLCQFMSGNFPGYARIICEIYDVWPHLWDLLPSLLPSSAHHPSHPPQLLRGVTPQEFDDSKAQLAQLEKIPAVHNTVNLYMCWIWLIDPVYYIADYQRKFRNLTSDYTESCCWRSVNQEMWSRRCDTAEMWDMRIWRVGSARNAVFFHSFVASQARKVRS